MRPEDVLYGGLVPGSISGLYQFNVRIPATMPDAEKRLIPEVEKSRKSLDSRTSPVASTQKTGPMK